jgi:hypothetical protein
MKSTEKIISPKLAAPGAGLPLPELLVAKIRFAFMRRFTSKEQATENFILERDNILSLVRSCDPENCERPILIKRPRGLEDSSRFWSIYMTLDHLRITNLAFGNFIQTLIKGESPKRKADTAAVKPNPESDIESVKAFKDSCAHFLNSAKISTGLHTKQKHAHPWFGPLDAAGWHVLAGIHLRLHRCQIELILQEMV